MSKFKASFQCILNKNIKRYKLVIENLWNVKKTVQQLIVKTETRQLWWVEPNIWKILTSKCFFVQKCTVREVIRVNDSLRKQWVLKLILKRLNHALKLHRGLLTWNLFMLHALGSVFYVAAIVYFKHTVLFSSIPS